MRNVHAIHKYGVGLPVFFFGYASTSWWSSVSSTLLFLEVSECSLTGKMAIN
ncbi:hypothetical protein EV202_10260 [Bacteroides heparinolyticus]|uniref:Uncharacterized protein n=1 Tax=Prevotella heparinolytica TaxID=28113 RepID=A0A4R2LPN4_9BACE|nr:hypothetical protein EV202_10260 [Bacteroides heparinolyticus]